VHFWWEMPLQGIHAIEAWEVRNDGMKAWAAVVCASQCLMNAQMYTGRVGNVKETEQCKSVVHEHARSSTWKWKT
jgi:hypothetical protein